MSTFTRPVAAYSTALLVWLATLAYYGSFRPPMSGTAAGGAAYAGVLALLAAWLVRSPVPPDRLRATGRTAPLWAWYAVAAALLGWGLLQGFAFGGVYGGTHIPILTPWIAGLSQWWAAPGIDGTTILNFVTFAVIPLAVLVAAGASRAELGLAASARGTGYAALGCLALPAVFVLVALARGKLTGWMLGVAVVHNFFSNGFAEEFMCRSALLAPLRSVLPTAWAVVIQGVLFGLFHVGGSYAEEGGNLAVAAAGSVAMNAPMGIALGVVAARTGSLSLPTAIYISLHLMTDVLR
jgi:membrane protease YdiL (CAAX protease family)